MSIRLLPSSATPRRPAFTLIELLVVMGIVIILVAVSAPLLKTLSKSNSTASAANLVRAYLSNARAIAVSQHRQAGVVFFEETSTNADNLAHTGQTAMQLIVEDPDQSTTKYPGIIAGNTGFIPYSNDRQYLPTGLMVATLNDDPTNSVMMAQNSTAPKTRVILFDADGQLTLRNGLVCNAAIGTPGKYPQMELDWKLAQPGDSQATGSTKIAASSPGFIVFDKAAYDTDAPSLSTDKDRANWLQKNAQVIIVNTYTGGVIR
ncbi:MAG: pilus assembly FimT family protein [Phycisphaerae bacterium]